jgi:hypothetical protein
MVKEGIRECGDAGSILELFNLGGWITQIIFSLDRVKTHHYNIYTTVGEHKRIIGAHDSVCGRD